MPKSKAGLSIGIPNEYEVSYRHEKRVGLTPSGVRELCSRGHSVFVEHGAGQFAGYSDEEYRHAGAEIVYQHEEVFHRSDLIVKILRPQPEEYELLRENQILTAFFHLAVAPLDLVRTIIDRKITAIGYEIIQTEDGQLPILKPTSQITGAMAPQIAGHLLESGRHHGRGILLPGLPGIPPGEVVIIGAGNLGATAAKMFARIGAHVNASDTNLEKLEALHRESNGRIVTMKTTRSTLEKVTGFADVLILSILKPGERSPILLTEELIKNMKPGSVLLDFAINQGGAAETSRPHTGYNDSYRVHDVVHFCVPNVPAMVPRTSSYAQTNAILEDLIRLTQEPLTRVLRQYTHLRRGLYTWKGYWLKGSPPHASIPHADIDEILNDNHEVA